MNAVHRFAFVGVVVAGLTACAGTTQQVVRTPAPPVPSHDANRIVVDSLYVARVERIARRRGVSVHWLNPPVKRDAAVVSTQ